MGLVNAAVAVSHAALEVVEGDASGTQYSIWLTAAPQGTATVTVSSDPSSSPNVTFSPQDPDVHELGPCCETERDGEGTGR